MSEEQLSALLAKIKEDAGLREKFKGAAGLDAAVALAKEAGFDVSKADWLRHQAQNLLKLSDKELEAVTGGYYDSERRGGCSYNETAGCGCTTQKWWGEANEFRCRG
jgi:predicted ribosomally synthesized peptide with nif11-like leader